MRHVDLAVVDLARPGHQRQLRRPIEQEVRVDRDAVAADPDPRLVDVAVRLAVGRGDHLGHVDADPIRVVRELVGERDVHVAVGGVGELRELGRLGRRHRHDLGIEHAVVERRGPAARRRPEPADELRIRGQVAERGPAVQPLGEKATKKSLLERQPATASARRRRVPVARVADRQRRLVDDQSTRHGCPGRSQSTAASMCR